MPHITSYPKVLAIIVSLPLFVVYGCGDSSPNNGNGKPRTKKELVSYTWKVSAGLLDNNPVPVTAGGLGDLRVTFTDKTYSYTFPSGCGQPAGTISSTWQFDANETRVILDRSNIGAPAWSWEILELTVGNLKTSYQAPAPPDCQPTHTYVLTWIIVQ